SLRKHPDACFADLAYTLQVGRDPMEVEALLLGLEGVQQVAVVAYPDPRLTDVAVAYIQPRAGATLTEADVIAYCRGKVATFKIPRHVLFLEEFPMTGSGKVRKVDLRADALEKLAGRTSEVG
ncbi:MAG: AMP-binding enzyme, partial [Gammaproteobacteria bacterium]